MSVSARPRSPQRLRGQTLTEFGIIVFLVAVGTIGVVGVFGDNIRQLFGSSADSMAGQTRVGNGGTRTSSDLTKWSLKGGTEGNPGGSTNKDPRGNPGGSTNMDPGRGGGNPGGTSNSETVGLDE